MSITNTIQRKLQRFSTDKMSDAGTLLKMLSTITWAVSSLAQVAAITTNKEIPTKDKKFLIPQEIADGVVNVSLFWTFTGGFQKILGNFLNAKYMPYALNPKNKENARDFLSYRVVDNDYRVKRLVKKFLKNVYVDSKVNCEDKETFNGLIKSIEKNFNKEKAVKLTQDIDSPDFLKFSKNLINKTLECSDDVCHKFLSHIEPRVIAPELALALPVIAGIVGSIAASNIITPLVRNKIASFWQAKEVSADKAVDFGNPKPFTTINRYNNVKMNDFLNVTKSGGLRI
ncbi:MAG: hypothetical protein PHV68_04235 [Candidatus Gastranaerophilales bacterium]|nr:hypothetical protein [Candidatus Gastranaerophilales bacterium]